MGMLLHSAIYLQYKIMENVMVSSTTKKVLLQSETNTLVIIILIHRLHIYGHLQRRLSRLAVVFWLRLEMQFLSGSGWAGCVSLMVSRLGPHVINWSLIWEGH